MEESFELKNEIKNPLILVVCVNVVLVLILSIGNLIYYLNAGTLSSWLFISNNILFIFLFLLLGQYLLKTQHLKWAVFSWIISLTPIVNYFAVMFLWKNS